MTVVVVESLGDCCENDKNSAKEFSSHIDLSDLAEFISINCKLLVVLNSDFLLDEKKTLFECDVRFRRWTKRVSGAKIQSGFGCFQKQHKTPADICVRWLLKQVNYLPIQIR